MTFNEQMQLMNIAQNGWTSDKDLNTIYINCIATPVSQMNETQKRCLEELAKEGQISRLLREHAEMIWQNMDAHEDEAPAIPIQPRSEKFPA